MRKRVNISVAGRRQQSSWIEAFNPSPSQTISSPDTNVSVFPGTGDPFYNCAGGVPTHRTGCGPTEPDGGVPIWATNAVQDGAWITHDNTDDPQPFGAYFITSRDNVEGTILTNENYITSSTNDVWYGAMVEIGGYDIDPVDYYPREARIRFYFSDLPTGQIYGSGQSNAGELTFGLTKTYAADYPDAAVFDYYSNLLSNDLHVIFNRDDGIAPGQSAVRIGSGTLVPIDTLTTSTEYWVRIRRERTAEYAKIWKGSDPEPSGWTVQDLTMPDETTELYGGSMPQGGELKYKPGFSIGLVFTIIPGSRRGDCDPSTKVSFAEIHTEPAWPGFPDACPTDPGYYYDTLVKKTNYWLPQSDNVSYYSQVYFDGMSVTEGVDYWLDGLKLYPTDPAIFADTTATAEVVIN